MKMTTKIVLMLLAVGMFTACNEDDASPPTHSVLIGTWRLIAQLKDPGDGSGTFQAVESDKQVTFYTNGTFGCNGVLCDMSIAAENPSSGTYDVADSAFQSSDCFDPDYGYSFSIIDAHLLVYYPCFEPCIAKYEKK
jgi:hypothetical protein